MGRVLPTDMSYYSGWDQEYDLDIVPDKVPWWRRLWEWVKE